METFLKSLGFSLEVFRRFYVMKKNSASGKYGIIFKGKKNILFKLKLCLFFRLLKRLEHLV